MFQHLLHRNMISHVSPVRETDKRCASSTYRDGRGRGGSLRREPLLSGGPLRRLAGWRIGATLGLPWWRIGASWSLALRHDGLELLQLLVLHPKLVLHLQLHRIDASVLHSKRQSVKAQHHRLSCSNFPNDRLYKHKNPRLAT